jgi:hypothetical protein
MADDEQHPNDQRPAGDQPTQEWPGPDRPAPAPDADETAVLSRGDEATAQSLPAGDETPRAAAADETQVLNAGDATQVLATGDATQAIANADQTTIIPPRGGQPAPDVDHTAVLPTTAAWAGRAGVRPPDAGGVRQATPPEEWHDFDDSGRRWWLPIVLGVLALLMLGVLGVGVWLIMRTQNDKPAPATSVSATPTASAQPSQTSASAAPTSASPSPTESGPAQVQVPVLVGLTAEQAESALRQNQLNFQLLYRYDPNTPVGNVIETDPLASTLVDQGSTVTLVISSAPPSSSATPSDSSTSGSPAATSASPSS